jgi:sialate O-acetylesterase
VELGTSEQSSNYVWVSVDAFTSDLGKIGVPTFESGAFFQQELSAMNVLSNAPGVVNGSRLKGNIEFWPNSYTGVNGKAIPDASPKVFDFGDMPVGNVPVAGHGSMQIHNPGAKQTLFALNDWRHGATAGLGIGNSPKGNPDWTFEKNAKSYAYKRLRVFVHPKQ